MLIDILIKNSSSIGTGIGNSRRVSNSRRNRHNASNGQRSSLRDRKRPALALRTSSC